MEHQVQRKRQEGPRVDGKWAKGALRVYETKKLKAS
jgi:hypothetical protein